MDNIYYEPHSYNLSIVAELDNGEGYDFDIHVVFLDDNGNLYYAHDSGCSCPCPFEDFKCIQDMEIITKESFNSFEDTIMGTDLPIGDKIKFLDKVRKQLK